MIRFAVVVHETNGLFGLTLSRTEPNGASKIIPVSEALQVNRAKAESLAQELTGLLVMMNPGATVQIDLP